MQDRVRQVVDRYVEDEIMLDALLQWATNPTPMSAGYALEENYPYIAQNLTFRYGMTAAAANERVSDLRKISESLIGQADGLLPHLTPRHRIGAVQGALIELLQQGEHETGFRLLRQGVLRRTKEASEQTRRALLLLLRLEEAGISITADSLTARPEGNWAQAGFQARYRAVFGETAPVVRISEELVRAGAYNKLYWIRANKTKNRGPHLEIGILPAIEEIESTGTAMPPMPDIPGLLQSLWDRNRFDLLRVLDMVSHSYQGAWQSDEPLPLEVEVPGVLGTHGKTVALPPWLVDSVRNYVDRAKDARIESCRAQVERAIMAVERDAGRDGKAGRVCTSMGEVLWIVEVANSPPLYVYLSPWLTDGSSLREVKLKEEPHVLFVIPCQSKPSFVSCLEHVGWSVKDGRWKKHISLLMDPGMPERTETLIGQRHPLLEPLQRQLQGKAGPAGETTSGKKGVRGSIPSSADAGGPLISGQAEEQYQKRGGKPGLLNCFKTGYAVEPVDSQWLKRLEQSLQAILGDLGIGCTVDSTEFEAGPRLVRANIRLNKGLRISKVTQAAPDIANKLFADRELFQFAGDDDVPKNVRIESVPAKGTVGIYVPRNDFRAIPIGALLPKLPQDNPLSSVVGVNTIGQPQFSNLDSMPHLLVSGQPGAGKSVFLNTIIVSLAFQNEPTNLEFILIDPKGGLEFGPYEALPHVLDRKIIRNSKEAVSALRASRGEMERRYELMREEGEKRRIVRDIKEYNRINGITLLPYRVIIIDEFSDLVLSQNGKDILEVAQAIAQKGRAAGIHIVICTQRPSVKVLPGDIKAVIPSRLTFRLPTGVDSKVILDEQGAEDLLGRGDMFVRETMHPELRRFQGALVTNEEIQAFAAAASSLYGTKQSTPESSP